jgi:hypothetical protein
VGPPAILLAPAGQVPSSTLPMARSSLPLPAPCAFAALEGQAPPQGSPPTCAPRHRLPAFSSPSPPQALSDFAQKRLRGFSAVGTTEALHESVESAAAALGMDLDGPAYAGGEVRARAPGGLGEGRRGSMPGRCGGVPPHRRRRQAFAAVAPAALHTPRRASCLPDLAALPLAARRARPRAGAPTWKTQTARCSTRTRWRAATHRARCRRGGG